MVFAIGNHDNRFANAFLLTKAAHRKVNGLGDVSALCGDESWVDVLQEHLSRNVVGGNGQLHKGISCEHHQSDAVVCKVIYEILDE